MGVKANVFYSMMLTASHYVFQLVTYPYVSRILGPEGIGACNFVLSIVDYFIIFSMFGVLSVGTREIARCRGDQSEMNRVYSEIFILNALCTVVALAVYLVCAISISELSYYQDLLYIGLAQIAFNFLSVEWLFRGVEDFKYIALRSFIIKLVYTISVFLLVKDQDDQVLYYSLMVSVVVLTGMINIHRSRLVAKLSLSISWSSALTLFRGILTLGAQNILVTMYTTLNVIYLGFIAGDAEVGYYTTATKLQNILLALYTSFTMVMIPRYSTMHASGSKDQFISSITHSINLLLSFSLPIIIVSIVFASELVAIVAGQGYEPAVLLLQLSLPLVLVVGLEQVFIIQTLTTMRADQQVFVSTLIGALVGIIANILLVPEFKGLGSVFVWISSELTILAIAIYFCHSKHKIVFPIRAVLTHIVFFLPLVLFEFLLHEFVPDRYVALLFGGLLAVAYKHVSLVYFLRNTAYIDLIHSVFNKLISQRQ